MNSLQQLLQKQQHSSSVPSTSVVEILVDDSLAAIAPLRPVQDLRIPSEIPTAADISDIVSLSGTEKHQVHCNLTAAQLKFVL